MDLLIHIIDDNEMVCNSLERLFYKRGHQVDISRNGKEALQKIGSNRPDLIFLDLSLPDINGIEVLRQIRKAHSQIPIVMISGHGTIEIAVEALKLGAWDFLTKPLNLPKVNSTVENLLSHIRLEKEVYQLRSEQQSSFLAQHIIGQTPKIKECYSLARSSALNDRLTILITGESGTGKEFLAKYVHYSSMRSGKPLVTVNCSALPKELIESELFGYERGAFTGAATTGKRGKFELAEGGTLFLDEIGDLHLEAQAKILRFLQEREVQRVGGTDTRHLNVRIIAATNQNLEEHVRNNRFREDLYYRLNVMKIHLPPLRERKEDIPLFTAHFIDLFNQEFGKRVVGLLPRVEQELLEYEWPGNIRELRNLIERAVHLTQESYLTGDDLGPGFPPTAKSTGRFHPDIEKPTSLAATVSRYVSEVLELHGGNKSQAAETLRISRTRLRRILDGRHTPD